VFIPRLNTFNSPNPLLIRFLAFSAQRCSGVCSVLGIETKISAPPTVASAIAVLKQIEAVVFTIYENTLTPPIAYKELSNKTKFYTF